MQQKTFEDVNLSMITYLEIDKRWEGYTSHPDFLLNKTYLARFFLQNFDSYVLSNEFTIGKHLDKLQTTEIPNSVNILYHHVTDARKLIKESNLKGNQPS